MMDVVRPAWAYGVVNAQNARIKKLHGKRFTHKGYEYEVRYEGGFATFVALYRREIGKRNFKFYKGDGCYDCMGAATAWDKLMKLLPELAEEESNSEDHR